MAPNQRSNLWDKYDRRVEAGAGSATPWRRINSPEPPARCEPCGETLGERPCGIFGRYGPSDHIGRAAGEGDVLLMIEVIQDRVAGQGAKTALCARINAAVHADDRALIPIPRLE